MMEVQSAHWTTVAVVLFTLLVTPFYWHLILPAEKARKLAWITVSFMTGMALINLYQVQDALGPAGGLVIAVAWATPAILVWRHRTWFTGLHQRNLAGLQIFRLIGFVFLTEMFRGHIPGSFAWPAGVGDILVGLFAIYTFVTFHHAGKLKMKILIVIGMLDFLSAFFFGFTSMEGPAQLFAKGFDNQANLFPTGLIPFCLVPYAITYHTLAVASLVKPRNSGSTPSCDSSQ
jgi:hypothetical protein